MKKKNCVSGCVTDGLSQLKGHSNIRQTSGVLLLHLPWCFTSTETIRLIRDGRMEVGEAGDYIPIATLSPTE